MARKPLSALLAVLLCALPAAGCWDAIDINDRDILTAVVVDKSDYGFVFHVEVPPVSSGSSAGSEQAMPAKPVIVKAEGRTLEETREELDRKMDKPVFLGAVQTVILTDRMASYGIEEYLLRLRQLSDYRKTVYVIVTSSDSRQLLETTSENAPFAGFAIYDTIESYIGEGRLYSMSLMQALDRLASEYKHYALPSFTLVSGDLTFAGLTLFSGGMKTGFIPAADIRSIVFMRAEKPRFDYTVPYDDTYASVEVRLHKKKIAPHYENGKVSFDLSLGFRTILTYPEKDKRIADADLAIIKANLKAQIEQEFAMMFARSQQEYHQDVYNLYEQFQNAYPEEYKRMNWADEYDKAKLNLSVSVDLATTDYIDYNPKQ